MIICSFSAQSKVDRTTDVWQNPYLAVWKKILGFSHHPIQALAYNNYRNDPTFTDRVVWANSVDPDQTAPEGTVWSKSKCHSVSIIWTHYSMVSLTVQFLGWLQQFFRVSNFRSFTVSQCRARDVPTTREGKVKSYWKQYIKKNKPSFHLPISSFLQELKAEKQVWWVVDDNWASSQENLSSGFATR